MRKSTKGALAAGAAGVLLLGGAGSLAYWTDAGTIEGNSITAGHLKLTAANPGCGDWELNDVKYAGSERIVPGDTLTRHCDYVVDLKGASLMAKIDVSAPNATGTLAGGVTPTATYQVGIAGAAVPAGTASTIADADKIGVDIEVEFPLGAAAADNKYNKLTALTAVLSDVTVTATQDH